jgi:lysophospholipase L1-like esterase
MTLQFGLNDCNCWDTDLGLPRVSEEAYRANLLEMIARARVFGAAHIILSTNHPTLRNRKLICGQTLEERRVRYNEIVREVAKEANVILCDIEGVFADVKGDALGSMLLSEPDVLHLSQLGHERYANGICKPIAEAVEQVIREKSNA